MSIRVKPVEPAVRTGHRSRMPVYVPLDPRYQVKRNPKFQELLDEVQHLIKKS